MFPSRLCVVRVLLYPFSSFLFYCTLCGYGEGGKKKGPPVVHRSFVFRLGSFRGIAVKLHAAAGT